ncbi:MAG TPA: isochorismatase family protein [Terriglobales bacterium]|nr:isochorismatase family protein [Terriglobales bacterium]
MFKIGGKQIPATLAELVEPKRTALLLWDMENAIAPNAFNYRELLANLTMLAALAREIGVVVFYSQQIGFDLLKEEAGVWVRVRMKRAKATEPSQLLKEKEDPHDREIVAELKPHKCRPDGFVGTDFDLTLRSNAT